MRGATCVIVQTHQILRLPRKMTAQNLKEICWKRMKRHFQCAADPRMIRPWSDHDIRAWSEHETISPQPRLPFTPTTSILYWKIQHFALRLSFQISPNTAPATKSGTRTSPNTAPATHEAHRASKRCLLCPTSNLAKQIVNVSRGRPKISLTYPSLPTNTPAPNANRPQSKSNNTKPTTNKPSKQIKTHIWLKLISI